MEAKEKTDVRIGGNGVIAEEWLDHCAILPYRGALKNYPGHSKGNVNAFIEIRNNQNNTCRRVQVLFSAETNRIYIAEKEFNRTWKEIAQCISRAKMIKSFRIGEPVSTYEEVEAQVDFSLYETDNRIAVLERGQIKLVGKPISDEQKQLMMKRSSAMDNKKIVYAYSMADDKVHDKACPLVKQISNQDFRASEKMPEGRWRCLHCRMMMVVRRGCGDDFKHYEWYRSFFIKGCVRVEAVEELVDQHDAKFRMEDMNTLGVKCREEQWKLVLSGERKVTLLHNNYTMLNDTERYISGGFHNQNPQGGLYMTRAIKYIEDYRWEDHLAAKAAKAAAVTQEPGFDRTEEPMVVETKDAGGFVAAMLKRVKAWGEALFRR